MTPVRRPLVVLLCLAFLGVLAASVAGPAAADPTGDECAALGIDTTQDDELGGTNTAYDDLHIAEARAAVQRTGHQPGAGVGVVVVDSPLTPSPNLDTSHGVLVAGILRGARSGDVPVGFLPGAQVVDGAFYNSNRGSSGDGVTTPGPDGLATRLDSIKVVRPTVVLIPIEVGRSARLTAALDRLTSNRKALVVAAAGDRPGPEDPLLKKYAEARPGEDAAADVWPAAHDGVLAVGLSSPAGAGRALRNSAVDVAAPGGPTASYGMNGKACAITVPSTHWAAAEVAAAAAIVWSAHPGESAATIRKRLQDTASGPGAATSALVGYGQVQPVEAIVRAPAAAGRAAEPLSESAMAPAERSDVLAETRRKTVWWGLVGGGALVVLLLAGRRRAS